jgi:hypothetical protein
MKEKKKLTVERSMNDLKRAYEAKRPLIQRQLEDFRFALGEQWSAEDTEKLKAAGFAKPFTDNRVQPNLFLLTGLERQNRTDFKAFPEGEEDSLKAEIASVLFKDAIKRSGFSFKSSEQFKDAITCGESHLEFYLDYTDSPLNGTPKWRKCDSNMIFPDPASREYDFDDAAFVYKITVGVDREDLINLFPKKKKALQALVSGKMNLDDLVGDRIKRQEKDYPKRGGKSDGPTEPGKTEEGFDLIERYYKNWVEMVFIGDKEKGTLTEAKSLEDAEAFVEQYTGGIEKNQQAYENAVAQIYAEAERDPSFAMLPLDAKAATLQETELLPPEPPAQDPERFIVVKRLIPEIWCFAHVPGMEDELANERAWCYPKWKKYPIAPCFGRFSTAPLTGDDRHLLVQGLVHGVKGAQEKHNKSEMLMLRHLSVSANSGWLEEEGSWVNPELVKNFGSAPGVNLQYRKGAKVPERIFPMQLSQGHAQIAEQSAEAIKAQLGINADLLATQQGGADSGRAIALRQKQGLLMVQELFDNLSRTRQLAGRMLLSQLGNIYDTDTAMKVLGDAFLRKNFPPVMLPNPQMPGQEVPMMDPQSGKPMEFDRDLAEVAIAEVLSGALETYDVSVGEAVASESQKMANDAMLSEFSKNYPGMIPPHIAIAHSQLPEATKNEILQFMKQQQAAAQAAANAGVRPQTGKGPATQGE